MKRPNIAFKKASAFTLMEILVVVAIILVLAAIIVPVVSVVRQRANKIVAVKAMQQLAAATGAYSGQHDGALPSEDAKGTDTWAAAADPENAKAWYNALPKLLGVRPVAEFATTPRDFYTKENLLFIPGAKYPETDKKLKQPLFAVAINTKLQRKNAEGDKPATKLTQISNAGRTVLFLEQGLPSESRTVKTQAKYDGSCKGSAKSFVGRYGEKGVLLFVDGHTEDVFPKDLLTDTGSIKRYPDECDVIWTRTPEEDPNKGQTGTGTITR